MLGQICNSLNKEGGILIKVNEFENLKVGDKVSPLYGKNKGAHCVVTFIWNLTDSDGYNEFLIAANYIDQNLRVAKSPNASDLFLSYRAFKLI